MVKENLSQIDTSFESYQKLINLYEKCKNRVFDIIEVYISNWFGANMSSPLGALLDNFNSHLNRIDLVISDDKIKTILQKNDFLLFYGFDKIQDSYHTTIKYQKLKPTDGRFFSTYINNELFTRSELPSMTKNLKKKIIENIFEIFINAQIHSETDFIYTCGQFYPAKNIIEFTITDTGIGFHKSFEKRFGIKVEPTVAIKNALQRNYTTKNGISGGLGLKLLEEFINKNGGKFQIISYNAFFERNSKGEIERNFNGCFPGTIVNLQFKTDDSSRYFLPEEIKADEFF